MQLFAETRPLDGGRVGVWFVDQEGWQHLPSCGGEFGTVKRKALNGDHVTPSLTLPVEYVEALKGALS